MHVFLVLFLKKEKTSSFFVLFAYLFSKERERKLEVGWVEVGRIEMMEEKWRSDYTV